MKGYSGSMYSQFDSYAAGRKVYSNGSYAPTRGQVNPKGYIKREIKRKNRMDSQSRSGLAQTALRTMFQNGGRPLGGLGGRKPYQNEGRPMLNGPRKPYQNEGRPMSIKNQNGIKNSWWKQNQNKSGNANSGRQWDGKPNTDGGRPMLGHPGQPGSTTGAVAPETAPYIKINSNGQLDLPYNEAYSWEVLNGTRDMNQQLMNLQLEQQAQSAEYANNKRMGQLNYQDLARQTLAADAGRGAAFSSGHGLNVANNATAFNNSMSALDSANMQFGQGVGLQRAQIETAFNDMLRQSALKYAQGLQEQAGDLGYGKANPTVPGVKKPGKPKAPTKKRRPYNNEGRPINIGGGSGGRYSNPPKFGSK